MRWTLPLVLLAIPTFATAQDTYSLKLPPPAKGDLRRVSFDMEQSLKMRRLDPFGAELKERVSRSGSQLAYVDECLDVKKSEVIHYRRFFENATEIGNDDRATLLPIHGRTLVVDRRQSTPQITWEDKSATGNISPQLEEALKAGKDKMGGMALFDPLPNRPVKLGESWDIDISAVVKDCENKHGCKLTGATGTGTLKDIHQGAKGPCARVEVHINVPLRTIKNNDKVLDLTGNSATTLDATYEFAVNGTDSFYASNMKMTFLAVANKVEIDGTTTSLRIEMTNTSKEQQCPGK